MKKLIKTIINEIILFLAWLPVTGTMAIVTALILAW